MSTIADLESDLCDAVHMASITATLLERNLGQKEMQEKINDGRTHTYYIGNAEALIFAAYETQRKITALRDRYLRTSIDPRD